ncbi:hypothetical protein ABZZ20_22095 [Streptomyces sp. NPDC006430]|uniref:hypothetical protein n=1 Tax=Streptomyces sp. NPDC006430 TaxID=3154299 RepID=UPI0033B35C01
MSQNTGWGQHPEQAVPQWGGNGWTPQWGGGARTLSPQPGVISLRPLTVGDILVGAFSALRRYWKPLAGVMLAVQGVGVLLVAAAIGIAVASVHDRFSAVFGLPPGQEPAGADVAALFLAFVPAAVLLLVTMTLGAATVSALCPAVVQEAVFSRPRPSARCGAAAGPDSRRCSAP